jgi:hypothetical protein
MTVRSIIAVGGLIAAAVAACGEEPAVQTIEEVKAQHEARLMATPGVVSVGIGRDRDGRAVIVVGVDDERSEAFRSLPAAIDGYPVEIRVVGRIRAR